MFFKERRNEWQRNHPRKRQQRRCPKREKDNICCLNNKASVSG